MKQSKNVMSIFLEGTAALYVFIMLGFFPLFYQDNFINISSAKLSFFLICTLGMTAAMAVFAAMGWLQQQKENMRQRERQQRRGMERQKESGKKHMALRQRLSGISVSTWFAVMFAVGLCLATCFSVYPLESLMGREGRKLGLLVFLLCIVMYGLVGTYLKPGKWMAWVLFASNSLVCVLAILNFLGLDPLGMYQNLLLTQHESFTSTIGNINACSSYLCMTVPVGMVCYLVTEDKLLRIASGMFVTLGFWTCYAITSESWVLGIGAAFLIVMWFSMSAYGGVSQRQGQSEYRASVGTAAESGNVYRKIRRFLELCGLFWVSSILMKLLLFAGEASGAQGRMFLFYDGHKIQNALLLNGYLLLILGILIAAALWYVSRMEKKQNPLSCTRLRNGFFLFLAVFIGIAAVAVAAANLRPGGWEGGFAFLNRLKFEDTFGSGRGFIWKASVKAWLALPLWEKFTGYGLNCYYLLIQQYSGANLTELFGGAKLVDAHNEFLQFLTTTGILGTAGYFGLLISTAVSSARKCSKKPMLLLGAAVPCAYLAQAMVNNPTVLITPYLFLMLGIIKSMENVEDAQ